MLFRAFPPAERARAATVIMIPTLARAGARPGARWIARRPFQLALDLPRQRADRHRRDRVRAGVTCGSTGARPAGSTSPGFVLSGSALALIVYTLSEGPHSGWSVSLVVTCGTIGVIAAIAMTYVELRVPEPDVRSSSLAQPHVPAVQPRQPVLDRQLSRSDVRDAVVFATTRGMTPLASGLTTFPQAFGIMLSSVIAGRLYARVGPRRLMTGGFSTAALTIMLYTTLDLHTSLWLIRGLMFARGLCMGFAFVPMQAASYATIEPSQNGRASSIFSTQRQVGVSIGVAIMASILAAHMSLSRVPGADEVGRALTGVRWAFADRVVLSRWPAVGRMVHPRRGRRRRRWWQERDCSSFSSPGRRPRTTDHLRFADLVADVFPILDQRRVIGTRQIASPRRETRHTLSSLPPLPPLRPRRLVRVVGPRRVDPRTTSLHSPTSPSSPPLVSEPRRRERHRTSVSRHRRSVQPQHPPAQRTGRTCAG